MTDSRATITAEIRVTIPGYGLLILPLPCAKMIPVQGQGDAWDGNTDSIGSSDLTDTAMDGAPPGYDAVGIFDRMTKSIKDRLMRPRRAHVSTVRGGPRKPRKRTATTISRRNMAAHFFNLLAANQQDMEVES